MKLFSILAFVAVSVLIAAGWALALPIDHAPLIIPLVVTAAALAAPMVWKLTQLLIASVIQPAAAALRSEFPAPLTGEPPATAFA